MDATGFSDAYSYLGDTFEAKNGVNRIERNFFSLLPTTTVYGGTGGGATAAASRSDAAAKQTAKEAALLRDYESFMAARDRDIPGPIPRK